MPDTQYLRNAHLPGERFFWPGGPLGVLLIHGYTATTAEVRPLAGVLHQAGYTVAGPLLPGHGTTPFEANRYIWQDWVAVVEEEYRRLQAVCRAVVVGGESMGGLLALYMASQYPEIRAVMAYAPALISTPLLHQWYARLAWHWQPTRPKGPSAPSAADERWQGYPLNPMGAAVQMFNLQAEVRRRLPRIRQPLLVVQGKLDTSVSLQGPLVLAEKVASKVKQIEWYEQSGHCVILDGEWQLAAERTLTFLQQVFEEV